MYKLIQRLYYKLPKHIKNIWYNRAVHCSNEKFPEVWDKEGKYINCTVGLKVKMYELKNGKFAYYKVVKTKKSKGSDWLYPSDSINCDLYFSHISF